MNFSVIRIKNVTIDLTKIMFRFFKDLANNKYCNNEIIKTRNSKLKGISTVILNELKF